MIKEVMDYIEKADPEVGREIWKEYGRQQQNIELIASENIISAASMLAMGSVLTNKYAEGYPGKRYYGGCSVVDRIESIAIERAKKLFHCEYANVQPHSGAQANMAVMMALCSPGDKVLGMSLDAGGHLTHGSSVNFSGRYFSVSSYGINEAGFLDYDEIEETALRLKPKLIIAGASAYPRIIDFRRFREIADRCGAILWVDMAHIAGLVAAGLHPSPIPYAHVTTTTTHKTLRGPRGGLILSDKETAERFQLDKNLFPGSQGGPLEHVIAAKAICFGEALKPEFSDYQRQILKNTGALAEALMLQGFRLVSGGTENHLMLLDLTNLPGLSGKDFQDRCDEVHITLNRNAIPNDPRPHFITSGVRIGTAAISSRGFTEAEMEPIAECLWKTAVDFEKSKEEILQTVLSLSAAHPIYEG